MNTTNIAIIIPAYNERKNLRILLKDIRRYLSDAFIVVVDDSLPQESLQLSRMLDREFPKVALISRGGKMGRGSAVMSGLAEVIKHKQKQYFFEMDADLAHSPADFARFLAARDTADMIIGSRYLQNSKIMKWPLYRLIQSKIINFSLRYLLGLSISDFTNGFRLYNRRVAEFLVRTPMRETGFIALSEIAYKIHNHGFSISEVPVSFKDRTFGKSNTNIGELWMSLVGAFRIRFF